MKRKGLSIFLSFILVLMLTVSFSVPVYAVEPFTFSVQSSKFSFELQSNKSIVYIDSSSGNIYYEYEYTGFGYSFPVSADLTTDNQIGVPVNDIMLLQFINPSFYARKLSSGSDYFSVTVDSVDVVLGSQICTLDRSSVPIAIFDVSVYRYNGWIVDRDLSFVFHCSTQNVSSSGVIYSSADYCIAATGQLQVAWGNSPQVHSSDIDRVNNTITQQTQQQTDTLTNGYDNSNMENSNTALSGSINDYDEKESQITDQATGFIDSVDFIDLSSQVQLLTGVTFASSFLQSLFVSLGDWGILVIFSLSVTLAFMLVGWFKFRR